MVKNTKVPLQMQKQFRKAKDHAFIPLTLALRHQGKRWYHSFAFFNAISYAVLAEGVVILVVLRLDGGTLWVSAVGALGYITLPFTLLGQRLVRRLGVSRNAGLAWGIRSACAGPMILAPWVAGQLGNTAGLWCVLVGALGFFTARAVGMVSFMGIVTELTTERERGALISTSFKLFQGGGLAVTCLMALFLGAAAPLYRYQLFFALGLVTGMAAAISLWRIPESGWFRRGERFVLRTELGWLLGSSGQRWFLAMMIAIPLTQAIARMLIILIPKQGYGLTDQQTVFLLLLGLLGGVAASYTYGFFLDMLGSRPLLVLTSFVDMAAVLMIMLLPEQFIPALLGLLFFMNGYVHIALTAALQHYFISITTPQQQLAQGIVTQGLGGLAAGLGLYLAGLGLEGITQAIQPATDALLQFRWFFAAFLLILLLRTIIFYRIPPLRSQGIRDSLNALLSPWDWRAIHAVKRAVNLQNEDVETRSLALIMRAGGRIYGDDLMTYLRSPSFTVRQRALDALALIKPKASLVQVLLEDVRENLHTTAAQSAYWLGRWQVTEAQPVLRAAVDSPDLTLRGHAIHALVELGDVQALPRIRRRFLKSENPLVIIGGAKALARWGGSRAYPHLLGKFQHKIPPQCTDQLCLSIARLLEMYEVFYRDVNMLRREPQQLYSEWQARYASRDVQGLLPCLPRLQQRKPLGEALRRSLASAPQEYTPWFTRHTQGFLERNQEQLTPGLAFLLIFLLLHPQGKHRKSA